jgi:type IV secretion system protein VirD4
MPSLPPAIFRPSTTYGSACWARSADVREAGLLAGQGIVLGVRDGRYLRHDGPEHVRPDGLHPDAWPGFSVIHDIKGENWQLTAGWRSQFSNCLLLDPTSPLSVRFNPLREGRIAPTSCGFPPFPIVLPPPAAMRA